MVDLLLLPVDGRIGKGKQNTFEQKNDESRWRTSLSDLIAALENRDPQMYNNNGKIGDNGKNGCLDPPLLLPNNINIQQPFKMTFPANNSTSMELEIALLSSLASNSEKVCPLNLESL